MKLLPIANEPDNASSKPMYLSSIRREREGGEGDERVCTRAIRHVIGFVRFLVSFLFCLIQSIRLFTARRKKGTKKSLFTVQLDMLHCV